MRPWENFVCAMLAGVALAGCETSETTEEDVGQVELTITAVDGDGNTWKLPPQTALYVSRGNFADSLSLDGDTLVQTFSLPVGNYDWELVNTGLAGPEWPLERTDPQNNVETVWATLVTPQPGDFLILPNQTTGLTLTFQAAIGGSVTFAKGTVQVDVDVDSDEVLGGKLQWGQTVQTTAVTASPGVPPQLVSRLPAVSDSTDISVEGHISGAWEMISSDLVCAPVQMDAVGSTSSGVADLLAEAAQAQTGQVCLGSNGLIRINMYSTHAPGTPTFDDLSIPIMSFDSTVIAFLPTTAFDGETVDLGALSGIWAADGALHMTAADPFTGDYHYSVSTGPVSFSFAPAPVP